MAEDGFLFVRTAEAAAGGGETGLVVVWQQKMGFLISKPQILG